MNHVHFFGQEETRYKQLPRTSRTFVKTPRSKITLREVSDMKVLYYPIGAEIRYVEGIIFMLSSPVIYAKLCTIQWL